MTEQLAVLFEVDPPNRQGLGSAGSEIRTPARTRIFEQEDQMFQKL